MNAIDCPDTDTLSELLEREGSEEYEVYSVHLENCERCQQTLAELAETSWSEAVRHLARGRDIHSPTDQEPALTHLIERLKTDLPFSETTECLDESPLALLQPGDRPDLLGYLGEYEVLEVIGRGGMGVVFKAFDPALQRLVAIKVLATALAGNSIARQRFQFEARAAAAVCHEQVVAVYRVCESEGRHCLVMQYVAGESVQTRINRVGPLAIEEVVRIGMETASGLAAAHAQGLIHRDIKPANLLLEGPPDPVAQAASLCGHPSKLAACSTGEPAATGGRVKITDFGLARMTDAAHLTRNGVVAGTPEYMAPEQARGESLDARADLFSLGSVLYACCTGVPPFRASTAVAVLRQVSDEQPPPVRTLNPNVPEWLELFIARLLAKDASKRFQTAAEVVALLEGYLAHLRQPASVAAPEFAPLEKCKGPLRPGRRHLLGMWLVTLAGLAAIGLGSFHLVGGRLDPRHQLEPKNAPEANADAKPRPQDHLAANLKQGIDKLAPFDLFGPESDTVAKTDEHGLRITLPSGRANTDLVGLDLSRQMSGDFEITAGYELLSVGSPIPQYGAGVVLRVWFDSAPPLSVILSRTRKPRGDTFAAHRVVKSDKGDQYLDNKETRATSPRGRLRLVRSGSALRYLVADGQSFREIQSLEIGPNDVTRVQLTCNTMYTPIALDACVTDLEVRADKIKGEIQPTTVVTSAGASESGISKGTLVAVQLIGLVLTLLLFGLGGWLLLRRRRQPDEDGEEVEQSDKPTAIELSCSSCGRSMKVRAALAGKRGKCPQCGEMVVVPTRGRT